jgi:putative two-component system response regulator
MTHTILAIDDDPMVLDILQHALGPTYHLQLATDARAGLAMARGTQKPDIVLLDVKLPDMHGYDVCQQLKHDPATFDIPIMFLSSHSDVDNITRGLEMGAVDYVSKPVKLPVLMARLKTHLRLREANHLLMDQNAHLESLVRARTHALETRTEELQQRSAELQMSQDLTIMALGSIAETRDNETGNHIQRTRSYVQVMCHSLSQLEAYRTRISDAEWTEIIKSSPLHDIGKVGIPDHILLKPGKLTADEFEQMKRHPIIGRDALRAAESRLGSGKSFLGKAIEIAYSHHERWDGTGYPEGLSASSIPLSARIMAVADVYDALISARVYKPAMSHADACALIRNGRGNHFDPTVVDCFLDNADHFQNIARKYCDLSTGVQ